MEPQIQVESGNITEIEPSSVVGLQRVVIGVILFGALYLGGIGLYGRLTKPDLAKKLLPFFALPPGTEVTSADISRGPANEILSVDATFKPPSEMPRLDFARRVSGLNKINWMSSVSGSFASTQAWTGHLPKGDYQCQTSYESYIHAYHLTLWKLSPFAPATIAAPVKTVKPAVRATRPGSVPSYPKRTAGTHSSIGSPGPVPPKSAHTGP